MATQTRTTKIPTPSKRSNKPSPRRSRLTPRSITIIAGVLMIGAVGAYLLTRSQAATPTFTAVNTRDRLTQCRNAAITISLQSSKPSAGTPLANCTNTVQNVLNYYDKTKPGHAVPIDGWYDSLDASKMSSYKYYRMGIAGSSVVDAATYNNMISYMNEVITLAGSTKPNAFNTGVPAGKVLSVPVTNTTKGISVASNGNVTITKSGVFDNMLVKGRLNIKASGVTIRYSRIEANPTPSDYPAEPQSYTECMSRGKYTAYQAVFANGYSNVVIEDSEVEPTNKNMYIANGIHGSNYTLRRVNIAGTVDGAGIFNTASANVLVEKSFIHDLYVGLYDYGHDCGVTHTDGIQVHYGSNITIRNNTIRPNGTGGRNANAAIMVNQNATYFTSKLTIDANWLDYGACSVNVHDDNRTPTIKSLALTNNIYGKNQSTSPKCAMIVTNKTKADTSNSFSGNKWEDGSSPAPAVTNGG